MSNKSRNRIGPANQRKNCHFENDAHAGNPRKVVVFLLTAALVVTSIPLLAMAVYGALIARVPGEIVIGGLYSTDLLPCVTSLLLLPLSALNSTRFRNPIAGPVFPGNPEPQRFNDCGENSRAMSCTNDYFISLSINYGLPAFSVPDVIRVRVV